MSAIIDFFYIIVYQPLFNLLIVFYNIVPDLGVSVILVTALIKGLLYPMGLRAAKSQKEIQGVQPEIKKIKEKYKNNREVQAKEMMELYRRKGINPFSSILPLFIQLPVLISLFRIFRMGLVEEQMQHLYSFVAVPEVLNSTFLGLVDLSEPHILFAVLAAAGQYLQMKMTMPKPTAKKEEEKPKAMQSQMTYFLPGFTFIILLRLPAVVGLYWLVTVAFSVFQQYIVKKEE